MTLESLQPAQERSTASLKLLLVDDLPNNLDALEALLEADPEIGRDVEFLRALSGEEALALLLDHEFAAALIDVQMPQMDGYELVDLMRSTERTRGIPILFVTAGAHDARRVARAYESGAVDFLQKPLDPVMVRAKVRTFWELALQKKALQRQLTLNQEALDALRQRERQLEESASRERAAAQRARQSEERVREADRRKDDFLAMLSHELRNPLAAIRNSLYVLDRVPPESEQAGRRKDAIERQVKQLSRLVDDLLDVTRIARNKIQLRLERLELGDLLRRTVEDFRTMFEAAGVALEVDIAQAAMVVAGDTERLAQVVGNVLQNACKFTPRGGRVRLDAQVAGSTAIIEVSDTGVGLAPELVPHVFEAFSQGDTSLARTSGGLGLGLSLVKSLIEMHDGTVSAASAGVGQGSTFTIRLPLAPPTD